MANEPAEIEDRALVVQAHVVGEAQVAALDRGFLDRWFARKVVTGDVEEGVHLELVRSLAADGRHIGHRGGGAWVLEVLPTSRLNTLPSPQAAISA